MSNLETNILATHLSYEAHLFYSFHVFTLHKYSKRKEMKDLKSLIDKTESKFQGPKVKSKVGYPDEIGLWLSMENSWSEL